MTVTATGFKPVFACWGSDDVGTTYTGATTLTNLITDGTGRGTWTPGSAGTVVEELSAGYVAPNVEPISTSSAVTGTLKLSDSAGTMGNTGYSFDVRCHKVDAFSSGLLHYVRGGYNTAVTCYRLTGVSTSSNCLALGLYVLDACLCVTLIDQQSAAFYPLPQLRDEQWHRVDIRPEGTTGYFSFALDGETVASGCSLDGSTHSATRAMATVFVQTMAVTSSSSTALSTPWIEIANPIRYRLTEMELDPPSVSVEAATGDTSATLTATVTL